jgi:ligand-binding SRPBCC domain-containing protein
MRRSGERAVGGVTAGAIGLGEEVTWRARHFGKWWTMTSRITELVPNVRFVDEQVSGPFRRFRHEHRFHEQDRRTVMDDDVYLQAPLGPLGLVAERAVLARYLHRLIVVRNRWITAEAERTESCLDTYLPRRGGKCPNSC